MPGTVPTVLQKIVAWPHNTVTVLHTTELYIYSGGKGKVHTPCILPQFKRKDRGSWGDGVGLTG